MQASASRTAPASHSTWVQTHNDHAGRSLKRPTGTRTASARAPPSRCLIPPRPPLTLFLKWATSSSRDAHSPNALSERVADGTAPVVTIDQSQRPGGTRRELHLYSDEEALSCRSTTATLRRELAASTPPVDGQPRLNVQGGRCSRNRGGSLHFRVRPRDELATRRSRRPRATRPSASRAFTSTNRPRTQPRQ